MGWSGCNQGSTEPTNDATATTIQSASTVKFSAALLERAGIRTEPVVRGAFSTFRDFPGAVKANETTLAEITTIVRGRVVEVYKSLGQDVQAGEILALLYSRELGQAQWGYLKAVAMLRVADQAFKRATYLLDEKVIGKGEFQRREGQLTSAQAEANEAKNQLVLLGMTAPDIAKLKREQAIRSHVPIVTPLSGRIIGRDVTKGEVVETARHLFTVADLASIWVVANVPEQDLSFIHYAVRQSTTAEVLLSAYPNEPITGQVTYDVCGRRAGPGHADHGAEGRGAEPRRPVKAGNVCNGADLDTCRPRCPYHCLDSDPARSRANSGFRATPRRRVFQADR